METAAPIQSDGRVRILVAVPTYRRPDGLSRLLAALAALDSSDEVCVLVADNEGAGGAGSAVVEQLKDNYRWPIEVIAVPEKGLAAVRNAMVEYARQFPALDFMAMVDDDERPTGGWLKALLRTHRATGASIIGGPTQPIFAEGAPNWVRSCSLFTCGDFAEGPVDMIWGTCNAMFHRSALTAVAGPLFDPVFNDVGGEDVDAFMRLKSAGCRFAWSRDAVVLDDIPLSRANLPWIARRAFRIGNSNMLAQLRWKPKGEGRFKILARAAASFGAHSIQLLLASPFPALRLEAFCRFMRSTGKLAYLFGYRAREYRSTVSPVQA